MGIAVTPERSKRIRERATRRSVLGARRVSPVAVSRVDPAELQAAMKSHPAAYGKHVESTITELDPEFIEQREAYKHAEAMDIAGVRRRFPSNWGTRT